MITDKRPTQLVQSIEARMDSNDEAIEKALDTLQEDVLAGKKKATYDNLKKLCGLSEGAIRQRAWAVLRLKSIKKNTEPQKKSVTTKPREKSETDLLRERVRDLLKENAILFEEILGLKDLVSRRNREIEILENRMHIKLNNLTEKK